MKRHEFLRRPRARGFVVVLAGAGFVLALTPRSPLPTVQSPSPTIVSSTHSCTTCRIRASKSLTLGSESDSLVASVLSSVVLTRNANYLAATLATGGADHIRVYGSDGRFLRRIGRKGQGPGEFRSITHVTLAQSDSIYVFEPFRLSVLSPEGNFVRHVSIPFATPLQTVVTGTGEMLVSAQTFSRQLAGLPVHRLSADGRHLGSFGAEPADVVRDRPSLSMRHIASGVDGRLWLVRPDLYEIEQWTPDGRRMRILTRNPEWFPPRDVEMYANKPTPFVLGLRAREDGNLWVLSLREDEDWRRHSHIIGKMVRYSPIDQDNLYDSMVEVINPGSGRLISSLRLPFRAGGFVDSHRIWVLRETEIGLFMIDIWQLELNPNEEDS